MDTLILALTSPVLPAPGPIKRAGYSRWDLEQAFRRYTNHLQRRQAFYLDYSEDKTRSYAKKVQVARKNYDYLKQQL